MSWHFEYRPYVSVAQRRAKAAAYAAKLAKKDNRKLAPIELAGRAIATSFWGKAWCENLEGYSDFDNRLPRGRTYIRNGSVIDLQIERGTVRALVSGSEVYKVSIDIKTLQGAAWSRIKKDCAHSIDSLIDLLQGRFDQGIMQRLSQREGGLFPKPSEIEMDCSCPDWAGMCKHVAATLYGVGSRLDTAPELLFILRNVDHFELISQAVDAGNLDRSLKSRPDAALAGSNLGEIFGIDLDDGSPAKAKSDKATIVAAPESRQRPRAAKKPAFKAGSDKQTSRPSSAKAVAKPPNKSAKKPLASNRKVKA